jgi:serine/threonine protein kinase
MLTSGTRIGSYEVIGLLGAGGMGEVYRATDSSLGRQVAIKVLPEEFASVPDRLARFEREAQTLASLNHPHIAAIYAIEKSGPIRALVMELVEGADLADRIARGAMPVDEVLPMARQIADALEAAHAQGIIHRDLKPANIKVRADGTVKVLDFGLAKLADPVDGPGKAGHYVPVTQSPTITSPAQMTAVGMILGTAAYMSPEQARGRPADKRADIWAFGCVLFEMLSGSRAFAGEDVSLTLAEVMKSEPDWSRLPRLPPLLATFLHQCFRKDPRQRLQDIGDMRLAIEGAFDSPGAVRGTVPSPAPPARAPWIIAAIAVIVAAALSLPVWRRAPQTSSTLAPETRLDIVTPPSESLSSFALSPDGRQIAFVASEDGGGPSRLWLRSLTATSAQPLGNTDGARAPFWSPDGRSLGFFADAQLKVLDLSGSAPRALAAVSPAGAGLGGTWNADGTILFNRSLNEPIFKISASGGQPAPVTSEGVRQFPSFLPDGRRFFFTAGSFQGTRRIHLGSLDSAETPQLASDAATGAVWLSPGWVLWLRDTELVAQRLDVTKPALVGEPVTLAGPIETDALGRPALSVSAAGAIAYRTTGQERRQLTWFDRTGQRQGGLGESDESITSVSLSPDARRVAVTRGSAQAADVWVVDSARASKLTFGPVFDGVPLWSPDGRDIAFSSNTDGVLRLFRKSSDGAGQKDEELAASTVNKVPNDWSTDGRFLLYHAIEAETNRDLWVLPLDGDRKPRAFLQTRFDERWGSFSPDGRWVAYQSNETGKHEIYIRPFAEGAPGQWRVSTDGGIHPRWRKDGHELFYISPDGHMMAATISVSGTTVTPGVPVALFQTRIVNRGVDTSQGRQYDISSDGRFLINTALSARTAPITLLQNWRLPTP